MRHVILISTLAIWAAVQAMAYTEAEVAEARQQHIAGEYEAALAVLLPAAEAGDAVAQNVVAVSYEDGLGVPVDPEAALAWYTRAADQGMGKAMHNLGHLLWAGADPVAADPVLARDWFRRATETGYAPAFANLGLMWDGGIGGPEDPARAAEIYQAGVAAGDHHSANNLGDLYRLGRGVAQDHAAARAHFARAGRMGLANGTNNLAAMHANGLGGPVDHDTAFALYRAAMAEGYPAAAFNIAELIDEGAFAEFGPTEAMAYCLWAQERVDDARRGMVDEGCARMSDGMEGAALQAARAMAATL